MNPTPLCTPTYTPPDPGPPPTLQLRGPQVGRWIPRPPNAVLLLLSCCYARLCARAPWSLRGSRGAPPSVSSQVGIYFLGVMESLHALLCLLASSFLSFPSFPSPPPTPLPRAPRNASGWMAGGSLLG